MGPTRLLRPFIPAVILEGKAKRIRTDSVHRRCGLVAQPGYAVPERASALYWLSGGKPGVVGSNPTGPANIQESVVLTDRNHICRINEYLDRLQVRKNINPNYQTF